MKLEVDCYSGRTTDERPVRFRLDGRKYMVEEVLDHWYGPSDTYFKVRADELSVLGTNLYRSAPVLRSFAGADPFPLKFALSWL